MRKIIFHFNFLLFCLFIINTHVNAQQIKREVAISAYLYNFAKNIQWQNEDLIKEFNILIIGEDETITKEIKQLAKTKTIRNKPIVVKSSITLKDTNSVQLILVGKGNEEILIKIFDQIEGKNILLVSDNYQDKKLIMINFYDANDGTLQFEINKSNIINQHLSIMPDMILLGGTEIDVATLYFEGQQSLRTLQKHIENLESNLIELENTIKNSINESNANKDSLNKQTLKIQAQQNFLNILSQMLKQREKELDIKAQQIIAQKKEFNKQKDDLQSLSIDVVEGNEVLKRQNEEIDKQKTAIIHQSDILKNQSTTIQRQRKFAYMLIIIIILVIILVLAIFFNYWNKRKLAKELEIRVFERTNDLKVINEQLQIELTERTLIEASLRLSEERYRYLFERNPASMLIYSQKTLQLLAVNESFLKQYGYSTEEILSMLLTDLYPIEEKSPIAELAKNIQGHAYVGEWHHIKKDGTIITIIAISHDLEYMGEKARIAVVTDITDRKKAEEEVKKLNLTLENRVTDRTLQLTSINKELESFSYSISHDLRAPLRAIFGFSQILARRHRSSLNEEGQQYMDYIVEASVRMEQLINDLLNYSRLGRKSIEMHPIQLNNIVNNIHLDFKQKLEEIGANFIVDKELPIILGDESLFRQIFTNLIENAVNYRRDDVSLIIIISCEETLEKYILKVADNGIGIPKEYWEKIFNIFQRLHSDDKYPGTGIGLATVQKAVKMLNGSIKVESIEGSGSTFIINITKDIKTN